MSDFNVANGLARLYRQRAAALSNKSHKAPNVAELKLLDEALHWINLAEIEELSAAGAASSSRTFGAPG